MDHLEFADKYCRGCSYSRQYPGELYPRCENEGPCPLLLLEEEEEEEE
jgi:hypothetical protein